MGRLVHPWAGSAAFVPPCSCFSRRACHSRLAFLKSKGGQGKGSQGRGAVWHGGWGSMAHHPPACNAVSAGIWAWEGAYCAAPGATAARAARKEAK